MANNIQMMERGPYIDPQDLERRQKLIEQLRAQSQHIPTPERSWTQGLARMMQGLNAGIESGQLKNEKNQYQQNRQSEMQKIAGLLNGGNPQEILSQLNLPETQHLGYGMAQNITNRKEERALKRELQNEKMKGMKELIGYKQSIKPRNLQMEYANQAYQTLAQGGQLTPAQEMALQNSKRGMNVNLGEKRLTGEQKSREEISKKQYEEAQKNKEIAINKNDSLNQVLNEMDSAKTGPLFDQRKAIASVAQFIGMDPNKLNLGDPNSMVIVTQRLNEYVLEVMKSMKGTQTENDREFVINSKPKPTDTPEQIAASIANLKKVNERTIEHGEAQEKWVDQYGSLGVKGQNGKSFQQNWSDYINSHPLFPVKKKR